MFVVAIERFLLSSIVKELGKHRTTITVSTDDDDGGGTWYPPACQFLKLKEHCLQSAYEKFDRKDNNAVHQG